MININQAHKFCKDDISQIENYDKAIADTTQTWALHHRDEVRFLSLDIIAIRTKQELIDNNRYYKCPANELIFLTKSEHSKLHYKYRVNKFTFKGGHRTFTEEHKAKLSASHKGLISNFRCYTDFSKKFKDKYGIERRDNPKLFDRESQWYRRHNNKCRWEE